MFALQYVNILTYDRIYIYFYFFLVKYMLFFFLNYKEQTDITRWEVGGRLSEIGEEDEGKHL